MNLFKTLIVLVVVVGLLMWGFNQKPLPFHFGDGTPNACTAEALLCPDGSAVGRSGPQCTFAACPDAGTLTGELAKDENGFRLITAAPAGGAGVTFVVPLLVDDPAEAEPLVGSRVVVSGSFTEGVTLHVAALAAAYEPNARTVTLRVGEESLADGVRIALLGITEDSRCPSDVQCIWAGRVVVKVNLTTDTDSEKDVLLTQGGEAHAIDSFTVKLVSVTPESKAGVEIADGDYKLTFRVDQLGE